MKAATQCAKKRKNHLKGRAFEACSVTIMEEIIDMAECLRNWSVTKLEVIIKMAEYLSVSDGN